MIFRSLYRTCKKWLAKNAKNTEHVKNGFKYSALKIWNDAPIYIREASSLGYFKKQLNAHLLAEQKRYLQNTTPWKNSNISNLEFFFRFIRLYIGIIRC